MYRTVIESTVQDSGDVVKRRTSMNIGAEVEVLKERTTTKQGCETNEHQWELMKFTLLRF